MSITRFDSKNLFNHALDNGITLFCGAGFSVLSKDKFGEPLPVGAKLLENLKKEFEDIQGYSDLSRACTRIIKSDKDSFYRYIENHFTISDFDPLYLCLTNINIKSIYTTNVDDLMFNIWDKSSTNTYIYDRTHGNEYENEDNCFKIDYFPLHGCVKNNNEYVFGATEIASAFSKRGTKSSWEQLAKDSSHNPILFWGWNFEDSGPIEAMYGNGNSFDENIEKWVLLFNPSDEMIDYLESLNFNIIIGDTLNMLKYINNLKKKNNESNNGVTKSHNNKSIPKWLNKYRIPKNDNKLPSYSIKNYFTNYMPNWSNIYSKSIPQLSHYTTVADTIFSNQNVIIIGIRCSGKTTLMMQLLYGIHTNRQKFYMISPTEEETKLFIKNLNGVKSIVFVDDCFRDTNSVIELLKCPNIQAVLFDRDYNYERQYHRICDQEFKTIDITEIKKTDAQKIVNAIPIELKKNNSSTKNFDKDPIILNVLAANMKALNFKFIDSFYAKDPIAAELFLMVCYVHSCGVPCSFDMIFSYLSDEYTWNEMFDIINRIGGLLTDVSELDSDMLFIDSLQNYYQCRSQFFAEKIINSIPKNNEKLKNVLYKFTENVPQYKICQYDKFRRSAYDASVISKAFPDMNEGKEFYGLCAEKDDSEYIYQQAALYFANGNQYKMAFEWIDKARSFAHYNRFSIDSTYAQIFFDVNIDADKEQAYNALMILKQCCESDKRRILHIEEFSNRVAIYNNKYCDDNSKELVNYALTIVDESISENNNTTSKINKWKLQRVKDNLISSIQKSNK